MKIIVDAYGGDNAPLQPIKGAVKAIKDLGVSIMLVGDKSELNVLMDKNKMSKSGIEFVDAPGEQITNDDEPTKAIRSKKESSMVVAMNLLKDGRGDAMVSGGSTGALLAGGTFIVKRIRGIKRAALSPVLPSSKRPFMLIDSGANVECKPEYLLEFGIMGSIYMSSIEGIYNPRVGLINNGIEEKKGPPLQREAFKLLGDSGLNFVGNVEARELFLGGCDVAVCDGFTGNIVLKQAEGMAKFFGDKLKDMLTASFMTKIAALILQDEIDAFKKSMDYTEYGGAPLLGISKPIIKAHGSSDEKAFFNAIRQAVRFVNLGVIDEITAAVAGGGDGEEDSVEAE